ncbi:hypothetical protein AVEN_85773-1 [Araneus ventricosus]|uniref:Uncharacterized protein n=1 Tax=Araneus ventricosus TaxID=182803 RepID=A0A4Y2VZA3_ARAVE|nr:hypothetical protein AVEN_85773-1 [Araneus ventricosus]
MFGPNVMDLTARECQLKSNMKPRPFAKGPFNSLSVNTVPQKRSNISKVMNEAWYVDFTKKSWICIKVSKKSAIWMSVCLLVCVHGSTMIQNRNGPDEGDLLW